MRSSVNLFATVLAVASARASAQSDAPPELARATGPAATAGNGADRYDHVGYATRRGPAGGIVAAHRILPVGSIAEVTALDTGRTILVRIAARGPGDPRTEIDLSPGAADLLGAGGDTTAVRVRAVTASAQDAAALARGDAASPRINAPPALLAALRHQLPASGDPASRQKPVKVAAKPTPPRTAASKPSAPMAPTAGTLVIQVAAFSDQARARAVARTLGGSVQPAGALWRVRLGPFRDRAAAQRARDAAARHGYADAQILSAS